VGAIAIAAAVVPTTTHKRIWVLVAVAAALPDVDAVGRLFGGGDVEWLGGHRALTHSLTFAALSGLVIVPLVVASTMSWPQRASVWLGLSVAIASHGALDALTMYGEGIQFLAPWSNVRYWAPWRPLGHGIVGDTIALVLFYFIARATIVRRGMSLPLFLNPRGFRAAV